MALDAVGTVAGLIDFALKIKATFDRVGENRNQMHIVSSNIILSLQRIERLLTQYQNEFEASEDLQEPLAQLEVELQSALSRCQRRYQPREGFAKYTGKFRDWKDGDDIQKELIRLEQNINTYYMHFLVDMTTLTNFNTVRMDATMQNMQQSLTRIETRIQRDLIPAAEEDALLAEQLVGGVETLEPPDINKAMQEAKLALKQVPDESIEQQYIKLQIKTLKAALGSITPAKEKLKINFSFPPKSPRKKQRWLSSTAPANEYNGVSDPLPTAEDAVMECIRLLRELQTTGRKQSAVQIVVDLRDLANAVRALGLRTEAHEICVACVEICRNMATPKANAASFDLALSLVLLSSSAHDIGERKEAVETIEEAVNLLRGLAQSRPQIYNPHLAVALLSQSKRLSSVGRHDEALKKSTECIEITNALVKTKKVFMPDLAKALIYHAYALLGTGRFSASLDSIERAVDIARKLVVENAEQYLPLLSKALNFLSICLREHRRYDDSIDAAKEAVKIRRTLIEARPEVYHHALTDSLNNLSLSLGGAWFYDEALAISREAIEMARTRVARDDTDPSKWLLAQSLAPFSQHLAGLDKMEESVRMAKEIISLTRSLAADNEALRTDLSGGLLDLGKGLSELGDLEPALAALKESVDIRRELVETYQRRQLPLLAESLEWMGWCLRDLGRRSEALKAAQESVSLFTYALSVCDSPDAVRMGLNLALSLMSRSFRQLGRRRETLRPARDAFELFKLFPDYYPPLSVAYARGSVLQAYSSALEDEGLYDAALEMAEQAVLAREILSPRYASEKSESDLRLAECLARFKRWDEAHEVATRGIDLLRPLATSRPGANGPSLARWLLVLCRIDAHVSQYRDTCESTAREAVELLEPRADAFGPELGEALHELAIALDTNGKMSEAADCAAKALNIRTEWAKMGVIQGLDQSVAQSRELQKRLANANSLAALNEGVQSEDDEVEDEVTW